MKIGFPSPLQLWVNVITLQKPGRCEQIFVQPAATRKQMDPFADAIYGAGTDLIETELGAYRAKLLG
ncbi:hypothetical protein Gorai_015814 [Gossypium raimondii]|uniref:Uncharacterized protein n=1 Tax=Gossypium raimondii TaxID=29730 RepID=A0A7J8P6Y7_GOSRA|nr:hypothetical protein [Gossypium raimondii]